MILGKKWKIEFEPLNYTLFRLENVRDKKTNEIKKEWKLLGYYGNIPNLINGLIKNKVRAKEIEDFKELDREIKQIIEDAKSNVLKELETLHIKTIDLERRERNLKMREKRFNQKKEKTNDKNNKK